MFDAEREYSAKDIEDAHRRLRAAKDTLGAGRTRDAITQLRELVRAHPDYLAAHKLLGLAHAQAENHVAAFQHLALAALGDEADYASLINLEAACFELGFFDAAAELAGKIDAAGQLLGVRDHPDVHYFNLGNIQRRKQNYAAAALAYEQAVSLDPANHEAVLGLIECRHLAGEDEQALATGLTHLNANPGRRPRIIFQLSDLSAGLLRPHAPSLLGHLNAFKPNDAEEEKQYLFALARLHHAMGDFEPAWQRVRQANALVKKAGGAEYAKDRDWEEKLLAWAGSIAPSAAPATVQRDGPLPIYILGPSRSGKSVLEKLLGTLDGVSLGYENKLVSAATAQAFNAGNRLPSGFLPFLPDALLPGFVNFYRHLFRRQAGTSRAYTTTTPGLISSVPALLAALPDARIVFVRRAAADLALRMYFKHYRNANHHTYDLKWAAVYIRWYYTLAEVWQQKFPHAVRFVEYEEIVAQPEKVRAELAAWCGLASAAPPIPRIPDDRNFALPYLALIKKEGSFDPSLLDPEDCPG